MDALARPRVLVAAVWAATGTGRTGCDTAWRLARRCALLLGVVLGCVAGVPFLALTAASAYEDVGAPTALPVSTPGEGPVGNTHTRTTPRIGDGPFRYKSDTW